jgi:glycyl-tRNA synthetase beta chain
VRSDLLIEIGVEEIPASYLLPALEQFSIAMQDAFTAHRISFDADMSRYATPRRLTLVFRNIAHKGAESMQRIYGPPEEHAFDAQGKSTRAATGFAASLGKKASDIKVGERKGKRVCYVERKEKPKSTKTVLKDVLPGILSKIEFPKKMRWEKSGFEFARPIRWIVLLMGTQVIRTKVAGVSSSNISYGPRFHGSKMIVLKDASRYEKTMEQHHIIVSFERRREIIEKQIRAVLGKSLRISEDKLLLDENANLVEYPTAFKGKYERTFLDMPKDVLVTAMKEHQRYFAVFDSKGKIKPFYIGVSNSPDEHIERITRGHDRVLAARLSDAQFYWMEDLKVPFPERREQLKDVEWHRGLGTMYDKSMRLAALSVFLAKEMGKGNEEIIERGALLAKVDLVTNMIKDGKEFTTLEGTIGKEYALRAHEDEHVAAVIEQHYFPRTPEGPLPILTEAAIVGIADRLDTLVGNFLIGELPSGSFDPFGLRRCAQGLLRILDEFEASFDLRAAIERSVSLFTDQEGIDIKLKKTEAVKRLIEFLEARLATYLSNLGIRYDVAAAVIAVPYEDLYRLISRIRCLEKQRSDPHFEELVVGQRRVANILAGQSREGSADPALFDCDSERILWSEYKKKKGEFKGAMESFQYDDAIRLLLSLRPFIDSFFDNCLVMDKDERIRSNRMNLLTGIREFFNSYADFSLIVLEGEQKQHGVGEREKGRGGELL